MSEEAFYGMVHSGLARRCQQVKGTFTLLWHNSSLDGEWGLWAEVYRRVVGKLAQMEGDSMDPGVGAAV